MTLLDEVKDFYINIFALEIGSRPNLRKAGYWLYHQELAVLHLFASEEHQVGKSHGCLDHIAFEMDDIQAFKQKLKEQQVDYREMQLPNSQTTQLFFYDPAGVKLEVLFKG